MEVIDLHTTKGANGNHPIGEMEDKEYGPPDTRKIKRKKA